MKKFSPIRPNFSISERLELLKKLGEAVKSHQEELFEAVHADLNKPRFEFFAAELLAIMDEIKLFRKKLSKWAKPKRVKSSVFHFKSTAKIWPEPYGNVLIIVPWNYPVQLALLPLIGAIAAGNRVMLKLSPLAPNVAKCLKSVLSDVFHRDLVQISDGDAAEMDEIINEKWDYIFFTGSCQTGQKVMQKASETLTPVTLELGGKSPCLIFDDADIKLAAKRICWGKFMNAGQTCVAPDYVLIPEEKFELFTGELSKNIVKSYTSDAKSSPDFGRIISQNHARRLSTLLENSGKVLYGGKVDIDAKFIEPTVVKVENLDHPIMNEEIFGPILPIVTYKNVEEAIEIIQQRPRPLALYIFSSDVKKAENLLNGLPSGGVMINDVVMHAGHPNVPFGGIGASGIGGYHGKFSFDTFSHQRTVVVRSTKFDPELRYPPYKNKHRIFKWLGL